MKRALYVWLLPLMLITYSGASQSESSNLYSAAYGNQLDPAIVFLHGGPGYNSFSFEKSTADPLAQKGYYVIVFDQRGCGRSANVNESEFTFEEAMDDLNHIYDKYGINRATLIGHSWGGTISVKFAEQFPDKVSNIILTDAPIAYQRTFQTILTKCRKIYSENDTSQLKYIDMLEEMDTTSLMYSSYCFMHAMNCGFYKTDQPTEKAKQIYGQLRNMEDAHLLSNMTREPVSGYHQNEQYTLINLEESIQNVQDKIDVYGIYGTEDGLFDKAEIKKLKNLTGPGNFVLVKNASHTVFIDQQDIFIKHVINFIND